MNELIRVAADVQGFCESRRWRFCFTCSAEDLIVLKAFAARGRDWADIKGIIVRQAGTLDWRYIDAQLGPLAALKEAPEILTALAKRRTELDR